MNEARALELIRSCVKCGACRTVCPLYEVERSEASVARGKIEVVRRDLSGTMSEMNRNAMRSFLDNCLLCGRCETRCPNQVRTVELFYNARAQNASGAGTLYGKKNLLRAFDVSSRGIKALSFLGRGVLEVLASRVPSGSGIFYRLPSMLGMGKRLIPEIPSYSFLEKRGKASEELMDDHEDFLFAGCVFNFIYPQVLENTMESLSSTGTVGVPREQSCCGLPALGAGDMVRAREQGKHNLRLFTKLGKGTIIFPCASCHYMVRKVYPELFAGTDLYEDALTVSERCIDFESYLLTRAAGEFAHSPGLSSSEIVSFHQPCHQRSISGALTRSEVLLKEVFGERFRDVEGADKCCGFGGTYNLVNYDRSIAMGREKIELARKSGIGIIASSCSGCVHHLKDSAVSSGSDIRVVHVAELFGFKKGKKTDIVTE